MMTASNMTHTPNNRFFMFDPSWRKEKTRNCLCETFAGKDVESACYRPGGVEEQ